MDRGLGDIAAATARARCFSNCGQVTAPRTNYQYFNWAFRQNLLHFVFVLQFFHLSPLILPRFLRALLPLHFTSACSAANDAAVNFDCEDTALLSFWAGCHDTRGKQQLSVYARYSRPTLGTSTQRGSRRDSRIHLFRTSIVIYRCSSTRFLNSTSFNFFYTSKQDHILTLAIEYVFSKCIYFSPDRFISGQMTSSFHGLKTLRLVSMFYLNVLDECIV